MNRNLYGFGYLGPILMLAAGSAFAQDERATCDNLPSQSELKAALTSVVAAGGNGGLSNQMWATLVNRDGVVCAVAFSGPDRGTQ